MHGERDAPFSPERCVAFLSEDGARLDRDDDNGVFSIWFTREDVRYRIAWHPDDAQYIQLSAAFDLTTQRIELPKDALFRLVNHLNATLKVVKTVLVDDATRFYANVELFCRSQREFEDGFERGLGVVQRGCEHFFRRLF